MKQQNLYTFGGLIVILMIIGLYLFGNISQKDIVLDNTKVALREVGHQLLLSGQDSTSLVLPIEELSKDKYRVSFENDLAIVPEELVSITKKSFKKANLSKQYQIEVMHCNTHIVTYSFVNEILKENSIIPCRGRVLPKACYTIDVTFVSEESTFLGVKMILYGLLCLLVVILYLRFRKQDKPKSETQKINIEPKENYNSIGSFQFYPDQNKLIKEAIEIKLSNKECEILAIFITKPNQVIKREELSKKVWEDNGVVVGRSLDTYISKLRKKLKEDSTIQIINVHGVGYKLEV